MPKLLIVTEATTIAIQSMFIIAKSQKPVNVIEISEIMNVSKNHLAKVLQRLVRNGLLVSMRGPSGGFMLNKKPGEITLFEIYELIEGNSETITNRGVLEDIITRISSEFFEFLKTQTLATVTI